MKYPVAFALAIALFLSGGYAYRDQLLFWLGSQRANQSLTEAVPAEAVRAGFPERLCDIRAYGAKADRAPLVTAAINAAIDACAHQGGGVVFVPVGLWRTGAIKLQSHINLYLAKGAELSFSSDLREYLPVVFTRFQGMELYNYSPLIYGKDLDQVAITGEGKLIGNGAARADWMGGGDAEQARQKLFDASRQGVSVEERRFGDRQPGLRPSFIQFVGSKNILLEGFTVENGPFWTIHPVYSENVTIRNVTINTWDDNTDGIVLDSVRNAIIEHCTLATGDDAIALKSGLDEDGRRVNQPTENVQIHDVVVTRASAGVAIGSEMSGGVRNIDIRDSHFQNTNHGFRIKTTRSRGGFVENVLVENVTMEHIADDALDFNLIYNSAVQTNVAYKPFFKHIVMRHISGQDIGEKAISIRGFLNPQMEDVRFEDIRFSGVQVAARLSRAKQVTLQDVAIEASQGPQYTIEDSQSILFERVLCQATPMPCVRVGGGRTAVITLRKVQPQGTSVWLEFVPPTSRKAVILE